MNDLSETDSVRSPILKTEESDDSMKFPLSDPTTIKLRPVRRELTQRIDLAAFQMRRLDVLEKLNQENYKNFKK